MTSKYEMSDAALVDPALRTALVSIPDFDGLSDFTLPMFRAALSGVTLAPAPPGLSVEWVEVPGRGTAPAVKALLYFPTDRPAVGPALLNIHGGGFVVGDAIRDDTAMRSLAIHCGCVVLSVNYRLAPETPFPGPVEDCYTCLRWLHDRSETLGIDRARIAVRGVSAGGGLASALALLARDRSGPSIRQMMLLYPMLDDRTQGSACVGQHVWTANANRYGWRAFLGATHREPPPYAAPARTEDLNGFPPTFLAVGSIDLFVEENLAFVGRLALSGVPVESHVYPGAYHGFNLVSDSPVAKRFEADFRLALSRAFAT